MSATSSKSRLALFLLVVIALVFFITSFVAVAFSGSAQQTSCTIVLTGEQMMFGECAS